MNEEDAVAAGAIRDIYALHWDVWPPTVGVKELSLSTAPAPGSSPPESVWARVSIFGFDRDRCGAQSKTRHGT